VTATFRSLRNRNYRLFFGGQLVSLSGTWLQFVAQDWLVLQLTGSGVAVGITTALQFTPMLLFGVWGGMLADRYDKRRLLIGVQIVMALLAVGLAVVAVAGVAEAWMVWVFAALTGAATVIESPTRNAFVAEIVDTDDLPNAVSLNTALASTARIVGPAVAGVLIATAGVGAAFVVNALSFTAVIVALWRLDVSAIRRSEPVARSRGQIRSGLRYAWSTPVLRATLAVVAVVAVLVLNFRVALPLLAKFAYDGGPGTFGLLSALLASGGLAGALLGAARPAVSGRRVVVAAAASCLAAAAVAASPSVPFAAVALAALGAAGTLMFTAANALLQTVCVPTYRGRVMALFVIVFLGSNPVGAPLYGAMAQWLGPRGALAVCAAAGLAAVAATARPLLRAVVELHERTEPAATEVVVRPAA
jgi:MFS family permease